MRAVLLILTFRGAHGQAQYNMCDLAVNAGSLSAGAYADIYTNLGAYFGSTDPSQATYPGGQQNLGSSYKCLRPGWNAGEPPGVQDCYACTFTLYNPDYKPLRLDFFAFDTEKDWDLFSIGTGAWPNSGNLFPASSGNPALSSLSFTASATTTSLFFNLSYDIDTNRTGVHLRVTAAAPSPSVGVTPSATQTPRPTPSASATPVIASQTSICGSASSVSLGAGGVADVFTNSGALAGTGAYGNNMGRSGYSTGTICTLTLYNYHTSSTGQPIRIDFVAFRTEAGFDFLGVYESSTPSCYYWTYSSSYAKPPSTCYSARFYGSGVSRPSSIVTYASTLSFSFSSDPSNTYSGVHMRIGPNSLLPSAAPFAISGGGGAATGAVAINGGGVAGIIIGVLLVMVVLPFAVCIACCGGIAAGCARLSGRASGGVITSGGTTIIMANPAAPAFQNPVHNHFPPQMAPQPYPPHMHQPGGGYPPMQQYPPQQQQPAYGAYPQQQPVPAFPPTPVYPGYPQCVKLKRDPPLYPHPNCIAHAPPPHPFPPKSRPGY